MFRNASMGLFIFEKISKNLCLWGPGHEDPEWEGSCAGFWDDMYSFHEYSLDSTSPQALPGAPSSAGKGTSLPDSEHTF